MASTSSSVTAASLAYAWHRMFFTLCGLATLPKKAWPSEVSLVVL
jgi:hypothetical protein